ncbi:hypothetical protein F2Q68_00026284, partial [Brassica cretica]
FPPTNLKLQLAGEPWKLIAPYQENYRENPLGDCTSTVSRTSQQTSAFSATLKRLASAGSTSTCVRPVTRRISADLGFPAPKLALWLTFKNCLLCLGIGDKEVAESYTVRRKASGGKRSKEASSSSAVARLPLHLISIPGYETHSVVYDC